jgi:DNA gyrase subunit A
MDAFAAKHRGGQGVTAIKLSGDKGKVVASRAVSDGDEVLLVSSNGVLIRMPVDSISVQGPYATGVKVMTVNADERVAAVAPVLQNDVDDADVLDGATDTGDLPDPEGRELGGGPQDGSEDPDSSS